MRQLFVFVLLLTAGNFVAGCDLFEERSSLIHGTWFLESRMDLPDETGGSREVTIRREVTYREDATHRSIEFLTDASSGSFLGYRYAAEGNYSFGSGTLTLTVTRSGFKPELVSSVEELDIRDVKPQTYTYPVELDGDTLKLFNTCSGGERCGSPVIYLRK